MGIVDGFWSGQTLSCVTHIFIMSLCHVYLSVMKAKIQFLDFRYWQFELTCWSTYSNHTKGSLCTLCIWPIPYWGIVYFPAHNEQPLLYQLSQLQQQLLVHYFLLIPQQGTSGPLKQSSIYTLVPPKVSSSSSCTIHLVFKTQQTNVKWGKNIVKVFIKIEKENELRQWDCKVFTHLSMYGLSFKTSAVHVMHSLAHKQNSYHKTDLWHDSSK